MSGEHAGSSHTDETDNDLAKILWTSTELWFHAGFYFEFLRVVLSQQALESGGSEMGSRATKTRCRVSNHPTNTEKARRRELVDGRKKSAQTFMSGTLGFGNGSVTGFLE